jgi:hypothetical protein
MHGTLKGIDLNGKNELIFRYMGFVPGGVWTIHLDAADGPVLKSVPSSNKRLGMGY